MHQIYDVLIIGCGFAGIGASHILSQRSIKHIMLESRDRIGGRIFSQHLDGVSVDMGAMVVHHPFENNPIKEIMGQMGWKSYNKRYDSKQIMIGPNREIDQQTKEQSFKVYTAILKQLEKRGQESETDISFEQAMTPFLEEAQAKYSEQVISFVKVLLKIHGNIEGAELADISARGLYVDDQSDVIPQGGYAKLLQAIFDMHKRQVLTGQKVVSINYASDVVQIKTTDNTYYAKRVISSIPLGVLKSKSVVFQPELTQQRLKAIDNLSVSIFNKIQVSFKLPFWDVTKQYIILASNSGEKCYRIRSIIENGKYILCGFVSGRASEELTKLKDQQILSDFLSCLKKYYTQAEIEVSSFLVTRWNMDEHSLGSYSYYHVGRTTVDDIYELRKPIDGKIWFVGEHCSVEMLACAHGAFESGVHAAKEVLALQLTKS